MKYIKKFESIEIDKELINSVHENANWNIKNKANLDVIDHYLPDKEFLINKYPEKYEEYKMKKYVKKI